MHNYDQQKLEPEVDDLPDSPEPAEFPSQHPDTHSDETEPDKVQIPLTVKVYKIEENSLQGG